MLTSQNICVITPTKGRHKLLAKMLESLSNQTQKVGQVIIADGGRDAENVINEFKDKLPISWLDCPIAGQIPQRKLALKQLKDNIEVIIYFDDDIYQEPNSLETLIAFWNAQETEPAGVSFNLLGMRKQKDSLFRKIFIMSITPPGKVLRSGYNTPITNVAKDLKSEWLLGGATAWRKNILLATDHTGIASSWAICEDLIFSYPVGKTEGLYVCADAKVHDIDTPPEPTFAQMRFRGRNAVLWRYYFVSRHKELSKPLFFWMMLGQTIPRLLLGTMRSLTGKTTMLGHGIGHLEALIKCLYSSITGADAKDILE